MYDGIRYRTIRYTVLLLLPTKLESDPCTTGIGIPCHDTEPHPTSLVHTHPKLSHRGGVGNISSFK